MSQFYAYNALNFYFNDQESVNAAVLYYLSAESTTQANTVYTDPNYGLGNIKGLT